MNLHKIRIAHITDIHISPDFDPVHGVDVKDNFLWIMDDAKSSHPDLLCITGDLCCFEGRMKEYEWILEQLVFLDIPWFVLPGNHDSAEMMLEVFGKENVVTSGLTEFFESPKDAYNSDISGVVSLPGWKVITLDTSDRELSRGGIKFLSEMVEKANNTTEGLLVFMHHPPCPAGVRYMDRKYPLENYQQVLPVLRKAQRVVVFCGHYHNERTLDFGDLQIYLTPSTFFQINPDEFEIVPENRIGWRTIDIMGRQIQTTVRYL